MRQFSYVDEVEAWLEPLDYDDFWIAVLPYGLTLQHKDDCDRQIADGVVDEATVLDVLKYFARLELTARYDLEHRIGVDMMSLH